ncbi:hypothetical protein KY289_008120 [Solanum tuberosum]|nr:hypothetical protein KY289_008120 [Solanum tuberosum]
MNYAPPLEYGQGQHINRPPLFNRQYYSCLKTRMEDFIQAEDYELSMRVTDGPLMPTIKDSEGKDIPKPKSQYGEADYKMLGKNPKAKCILVCGLGPDEFDRISGCTSAKQIWDKLQNPHQGKIYTIEERVNKVLRTLPRSREIKVTAITEAKDLTNMTLDELVGNLKTYEMNVKSTKRSECSKEKNLALKVTNENDESDLDEEDIVLISRNFMKICKKGMNFGKKSAPTKEKNIEKGQNGGCYKCGKTDLQIKDCPMWEVEWKRERAEKEKRELANKKKGKERENNQAMYAGWGTGSDEADEEEDIALMAIEDTED